MQLCSEETHSLNETNASPQQHLLQHRCKHAACTDYRYIQAGLGHLTCCLHAAVAAADHVAACVFQAACCALLPCLGLLPTYHHTAPPLLSAGRHPVVGDCVLAHRPGTRCGQVCRLAGSTRVHGSYAYTGLMSHPHRQQGHLPLKLQSMHSILLMYHHPLSQALNSKHHHLCWVHSTRSHNRSQPQTCIAHSAPFSSKNKQTHHAPCLCAAAASGSLCTWATSRCCTLWASRCSG